MLNTTHWDLEAEDTDAATKERQARRDERIADKVGNDTIEAYHYAKRRGWREDF